MRDFMNGTLAKVAAALLAVPVFVFVPAERGSAAGFAILEQSSEGIGYAFAGAAAGYGDGSEIAFNPAAMAWIPDTHVSANVDLIIPSAEFKNNGSNNPNLGGIALSGSNGPDGGELAAVPSFYVKSELFEGAHFGLGVHSPFGLSTNYDREWVGRYTAVESELRTVSITPAFSFEVTENFAIGGALNVLYTEATLSNAIDFGTIGFGQLGAAQATALGLAPQQNDGFVEVKGDDWSAGFTLGGSYRYGENSKIGLAWKSKIDTDLRGTADFIVPTAAAPLTGTGLFTDTGATAGVTLPESIALSWIHNFSEEWGVLFETQWTNWDRFEELRVQFDGVQPDAVTPEDWDDVWRFSVAMRYSPAPDWTFSAGWTFDEEPIPGANRRTPRIPGNDRNWLALGMKYQLAEQVNLRATYAHLFVKDGDVIASDSVGNNLVGSFDNSVDLVGLGIDYQFNS
ncbi:MAG: porin [Bdellovibrionales bacterium]|nr:porin [Bdellovibrionales bacterium]